MKNKYYGILKLFLLLSLVFSSGMNVRALEEEGDTEAPPEAAAEENLPEEIPETVGEEKPQAVEEESPESVDEEKPETAEEADPEPSSEEHPEAVSEEPETEEKEESGSEGESEALEEGNSPLNYVAAEELEPGTSYVLAYEEEGSYTLLGAKGKELQTISLPALNEETVSGNVWVLEGEYGVYSIRTVDETGTSYWLYLDENGSHLSAEEKTGWERNDDYLQYTDEEDNIYGLFRDGHAFVFYVSEENFVPYSDSESLAVMPKEEGKPGMHYLAFGSDRHNMTTAIRGAMQSMPEPEYVNLIGDMVGDGEDMAPVYRYSEIYNEVHAVFPSLSQSQVQITWGLHDYNVIDDAEEGVTGVLAREEGTSGLAYTGLDDYGNPLYYIYAIGFWDMRDGHEEPALRFRKWVDTVQEGIPVIAVCHIPINANRSDNKSAWYWNEALNYAATKGGDKLVRDVIFLHGHNHTSENDREHFYPVGSTIRVPAAGLADGSGTPVEIQYTYITAGYLRFNNTATLIGISDTEILMKKFYGKYPGDNVRLFDTTIKRVNPPRPSISLSETSLDLEVGGDVGVLKATVKNTKTTPTITWSSDHPEIAAVAKGKVKAKSEGKAVITASMTVDGTVYSASCTVTSRVPDPESITLLPERVTLKPGTTQKLKTVVLPKSAKEKTVIYKSSNPSVVTVSETGELKALKEGTAEVTASVRNYSGVQTKIQVFVTAVPAESIVLDRTRAKMKEGGTMRLTATVLPEEAKDKEVIFESSDAAIVTVDENGTLKALREGTATITVRMKNNQGLKATAKITVFPVKATSISLNKKQYSLHPGETEQIQVTVLPAEASNKDCIFGVSDETIVTVDSQGKLVALREGTARVTAIPRSNTSLKARATIVITNIEATGIRLPSREIRLSSGQSSSLNAQVIPENATDKTLKYVSDHPEIVTVDKSGTVKAVGTGSAEITITTANGITETCQVIVRGEGIYVEGLDEAGYPYTGRSIRPAIRIYDSGTLLTENRDYVLEYSNNVNAASRQSQNAPTIAIKGQGKYSGTVLLRFTINPADISKAEVQDITVRASATATSVRVNPTVIWNGAQLRSGTDYERVPDIALVSGKTDYEVTIKGINNFSGSSKIITVHVIR